MKKYNITGKAVTCKFQPDAQTSIKPLLVVVKLGSQ